MASPSRLVPVPPASLRSATAIVLIAALASACAPSSRIDVVRAGAAVGTAPQAYVPSSPAEPTPGELAANQAVERQLKRLGWRASSRSPDWKVETAYVVRSNSVGAFEGADPAPNEQWLVQPQRRPWWERKSSIHVLSVRLVRPETGEEAGRATARTQVAGPPADDLVDRLAAIAVPSALSAAESSAP